MKIQIIDDGGQVFATREMPQMPIVVLPDEYLENIEQNAKLVQGNERMLKNLMLALQDAGIINSNGIIAEVIDVKVGIATLMSLYESNADHKKMGAMTKTVIGIGKSVAGKARPLPIDVEWIGEILQQFGQDNSVLLPGIGDYIETIIEQLKQKFNGR